MAAPANILLVDDDREIAALIARYLRANNCRTMVAADARAMDAHLADRRVDLIVLDLMLPGEDGLSICRRLRATSQVPIIMLTARSEDVDRIIGLEVGADDYVAKPFNPRELLARIQAVLRRTGECKAPGARILAFQGWTLDTVLRQVHDPDGARIDLTGAEFDLLRVFCERAGRVLSRDQLIEFTQGRAPGPYERSVDILVSRLRRKIEHNPQQPELIQTIRSGGYIFTPDVRSTP